MSSTQDDGGNVLHYEEGGSENGEVPEEAGLTHSEVSTPTRPIIQDDEDRDDTIPHLETENPSAKDQDIEEQTIYQQTADHRDYEVEDHQTSSVDDTASIPDDTPSVHGSILSSPGSRTPSLSSPARKGSPSSIHRPFDRRFQSRISSSALLTHRAGSPAYLTPHSRQSSAASLGAPTISESDDFEAPWEVIRWIKLKKLTGQTFSEVGRRNFGHPTCLAVTDQIAVGTSRGMILVFDHQQNHKAIIGAGTKAIESGAVASLAISADHTTIAAGHATGHIFTWEITRSARPFLHVPPVDVPQSQARKGDGHVSGSSVIHIGFLGYRRTALVSADDRGMAFSHLATRGMGAVARVVRTTRILGRYPEVVLRSSKPLRKSSVLAFSPLPLGNVEQRTDGLGLVAMMTPYLLVIVSTTPIAQTQHKAARPKEIVAHSTMTAALAWFPAIKLKGKETQISKPKLAYAWSNILSILEVHEAPVDEDADKEKPPELQFLGRNRFKAEEAIVAVQWLSRSVLAVLTITQQLLILEDSNMNITDSFDLLQKNIYSADLYSQQLHAIIETLDEEDSSMHGVVADAFHMSFRAYKGRLFLLGCNDVWWGSLTNWADRLLAMMNIGDFVGAVRLATRYYTGYGEKLTIGLPEDDATRTNMVGEKLLEMINASLKYAFGKNKHASDKPVDEFQLKELAEACIVACVATGDLDFLFDEVFSWYEEHACAPMFADLLEPYIVDGQISSLPPSVVKSLIDHFVTTHSPSKLEEIICLLDTSSMDIDQVTTLCKQYNLYDAYIYVWSNSLRDYVTPLEELLQLIPDPQGMNGHATSEISQTNNAHKVFPYISFILTSRSYPTGAVMDNEISSAAKSQIYEFFFLGNQKIASRGRTRDRTSSRGFLPYENLRKILKFDTPSFMSALNEAFEDPFLNSDEDDTTNGVISQPVTATQRTTYNRHFIVLIMLEVMSTGFAAEDTIYLDMFLARNLPKYPQYLRLTGTALEEIFRRLCHYPDSTVREDAQLSAEYLLSVYDASNSLALVPLLREAGFYRVLKTVFRQEHQYTDMVQTYFDDDEEQDGIFQLLRELLRPKSGVSKREQNRILDIVQEHASEMTELDVRTAATTIDDVAEHLHPIFLQSLSDDGFGQFQYLNALLEPEDNSHMQRKRSPQILEQYVRLMCRFQPEHVPDYVDTVKEGDLRLPEVLPLIEATGIIDAAVILETRSGQANDAMQRLTAHLHFLKGMLQGLLVSATETSDSVSTNEAFEDLLSTIEKYTRVGIWLCQGQSKISQKSKPVVKSPKRSNSLRQPLSNEEQLWLELLMAVVGIARDTSTKPGKLPDNAVVEDADVITSTLRNVVQQVFTALLTVTASTRGPTAGSNDFVFLRILRAFLSQAAESSPSLSELRNVIASIFSAYAHEETLLALSNSMLDKDVFVHIDHVTQMRQQGWRPRGQMCEICRRRVWGPGIGGSVWEAWQNKEDSRALRRRHVSSEAAPAHEDDSSTGKGKAAANLQGHADIDGRGSDTKTNPTEAGLGPIVVFSCRHMYHQKCLRGEGRTVGDETADPVAPSGGENAQLACPMCL